MKEQINIYKDICKSFISRKSDGIGQVEDINDIMFSARLTMGIIIISNILNINSILLNQLFNNTKFLRKPTKTQKSHSKLT